MQKIEPYWQGEGIMLYREDCLEVLPTLSTEGVDAVITDPPYGIGFQSARRTESERMPKIANDEKPFTEWLLLLEGKLTDDAIALVFCRWDVQEDFKQAMMQAGFNIRAQVIWDRVVHGLGDLEGQPAPQHDVIWFGTRGKFKFRNGRPKSVIRVQRIAPDKLRHPNEKPEPLMQHFLAYYTMPGQVILDPFLGSGTTLAVATRMGRRGIGCEIDSHHFRIACERIQLLQQRGWQLGLPGA